MFEFEIFVSKYVSKHSESIPIKKKFRSKFLTLSFFTILALLAEKRQNPRKKLLHGKKIFDFEIFGLKNGLKHSESITTKNRPNFFDFAIFHDFWQKWLSPRKNFVVGKNFRFRDFRFKIRFEIFWIDSDQKKIRPKFSGLFIFY